MKKIYILTMVNAWCELLYIQAFTSKEKAQEVMKSQVDAQSEWYEPDEVKFEIDEKGTPVSVYFKVSKDAKITIDVFSYDMRKIRTIVKDAPRSADKSRSTNPKEDFWDGKDKAGRPCTMGVYYVRVKDNHGHIGWGKVMTLGGHK